MNLCYCINIISPLQYYADGDILVKTQWVPQRDCCVRATASLALFIVACSVTAKLLKKTLLSPHNVIVCCFRL